jgi:hypothetical protein
MFAILGLVIIATLAGVAISEICYKIEQSNK